MDWLFYKTERKNFALIRNNLQTLRPLQEDCGLRIFAVHTINFHLDLPLPTCLLSVYWGNTRMLEKTAKTSSWVGVPETTPKQGGGSPRRHPNQAPEALVVSGWYQWRIRDFTQSLPNDQTSHLISKEPHVCVCVFFVVVSWKRWIRGSWRSHWSVNWSAQLAGFMQSQWRRAEDHSWCSVHASAWQLKSWKPRINAS